MDCFCCVYIFFFLNGDIQQTKKISKVSLCKLAISHFGYSKMFPSNTEGFETGTVILLPSSSTCVFWVSASSSWMRQSWELHRSDSVLIADWSISCGAKAGVFTPGREGQLSFVLAPVIALLSFESGARDGVVVRMMGSLKGTSAAGACWP